MTQVYREQRLKLLQRHWQVVLGSLALQRCAWTVSEAEGCVCSWRKRGRFASGKLELEWSHCRWGRKMESTARDSTREGFM
jgi:hypothetical protein